MRRSNSDTALDQRHLEGTTASEPYADPAVQPPNEASVRASVKIPRQQSSGAHNAKAQQHNGQQPGQRSPAGAEAGESWQYACTAGSAVQGWKRQADTSFERLWLPSCLVTFRRYGRTALCPAAHSAQEQRCRDALGFLPIAMTLTLTSPDAEPRTPRKSNVKKLFSGFLRRRSSSRGCDSGNAGLQTPPSSARVCKLPVSSIRHCSMSQTTG